MSTTFMQDAFSMALLSHAGHLQLGARCRTHSGLCPLCLRASECVAQMHGPATKP